MKLDILALLGGIGITIMALIQAQELFTSHSTQLLSFAIDGMVVGIGLAIIITCINSIIHKIRK